MGFWPRIVVTAVVTAAVFAGGWQGVEATGAGQGAAIAVASIAATVVVTLGALWVSRARGSDDPSSGGVSVVMSRSPSGQAIGQAHGPVFGPGSDFSGATITIGTPAAVFPAVPVSVPGPGGGRVVVGEIPQEPSAFQDRPDLLAALMSPPGNGRVSVVFAVTGLRGVGKSQLAAACARRRLEEGWPVVAWINAEDREEMLAGYAQLAAQLGLAADAPDSAEAARRVRHWLEADGERCLLVLDNGCDADVLRPFLPAAGRAQVIVTSAKASLADLGAKVPVDVFTLEQATAFLAERTGLNDEQGALAVAGKLGYLPLALAQAGAVIAGQRLDYPTYLRRLATVRLDDYVTRPEADPYPRGTAEAITLALDAALRDDPDGSAGRLLGTIALLSPAGAPRTLVAGAADATTGDADAALGHLAAWSLVTFSVDGSAVSAHRLVMRVVRERSAADGSLAAVAGDVIGALRAMLPTEEDAWQHLALMREFVTQVTALSDHLDTFLGFISDQAEGEILGLLGWAGWYLKEISDVSRSIPLLERTLTDAVRVLGPDHPDNLVTRNDLAGAYRVAGRLDEAIALHEQVLDDQQRLLGPDHPDNLVTRNDLAAAYRVAGRLDEAIALHQQVLDDRQRVLGPDHPDTLRSGNDLAVAYWSAGRLDEAIALHEQVLDDQQRLLGPDHPDTLISRNNLASTYESAGRLDRAIAVFEQVLVDAERVLGAGHPTTRAIRENLAAAQAGLRKAPPEALTK